MIAMKSNSLALHVRQQQAALLQTSWLVGQGPVFIVPMPAGTDGVDDDSTDLLSAAKFTLGPAGLLGG